MLPNLCCKLRAAGGHKALAQWGMAEGLAAGEESGGRGPWTPRQKEIPNHIPTQIQLSAAPTAVLQNSC